VCEGRPSAQSSFVIGDLKGQLGNQLFIIAAATSLALDHNADPLFPDLIRKSEFDIPLNYQKVLFRLKASQIPDHLIGFHYAEPSYTYHPIPYKPHMKISGYFQSEKYFQRHKREIVELFAPSNEICDYLADNYSHIIQHPQSVAVHVRSYLIEDPGQGFYYTYTREYYEHAMQYFPENALFVVFSNQMAWCKKMLEEIPKQMIFIEREPHYIDFYLMSMCKNNIISNSSFSWWAAYLNRNPYKIVVVPPKWFNPASGLNTKDLIPPEWYIAEY
jgi:hypothetical protein